MAGGPARMIAASATGSVRKRTLPALAECDQVSVVGLHGRDLAKLEELAAQYAVEATSIDLEHLLDNVACDFLFIGSPTFLHGEHVRAALTRRIPVLCEKPLALDSQTVAELEELSRSTETALRIAHHLRHQPATRFIRETLANGDLGPPRIAMMEWSFALNPSASNAVWKLSHDYGGRPLLDAGVHAIDMAIHLFGRPQSAYETHTTQSRYAVPDTAAVVLEYPGHLVFASASQSLQRPRNALTVECEDGVIHSDSFFAERSAEGVTVTTAGGDVRTTFAPVNCYREEIVDFIGCLAGRTNVCATPTEARWAVLAAEGARVFAE